MKHDLIEYYIQQWDYLICIDENASSINKHVLLRKVLINYTDNTYTYDIRIHTHIYIYTPSHIYKHTHINKHTHTYIYIY